MFRIKRQFPHHLSQRLLGWHFLPFLGYFYRNPFSPSLLLPPDLEASARHVVVSTSLVSPPNVSNLVAADLIVSLQFCKNKETANLLERAHNTQTEAKFAHNLDTHKSCTFPCTLSFLCPQLSPWINSTFFNPKRSRLHQINSYSEKNPAKWFIPGKLF